jgi:hypothetical protein
VCPGTGKERFNPLSMRPPSKLRRIRYLVRWRIDDRSDHVDEPPLVRSRGCDIDELLALGCDLRRRRGCVRAAFVDGLQLADRNGAAARGDRGVTQERGSSGGGRVGERRLGQ